MEKLQHKTRIVGNKKVRGNYYAVTLAAPGIAGNALPGQFVEVKIEGRGQPFLRRPFSIHRIKGKDKVELLYEIKGRGTEILSQKMPGEYLDIIGPLGNGFSYERRTSAKRSAASPKGTNDERLILVAGGMGVAPLLFLAEQLFRRPSSVVRRNILVLLGAKNKKEVLCVKEFKKLGCEVKISTDNGSMGFKGRVTDLLRTLRTTNECEAKRSLPEGDERRTTIYACGPSPMLKEISRISSECKIPAQVSMEEHMSCGIGVCMGCVVDTRLGYKRVCKDGPVFNAQDLVWLED